MFKPNNKIICIAAVRAHLLFYLYNASRKELPDRDREKTQTTFQKFFHKKIASV